MLRFLQGLYHIVGLVKLLAQVTDNTSLVLLQVRCILFEAVHQAAEGLVLLNGARRLTLPCLAQFSHTLQVLVQNA